MQLKQKLAYIALGGALVIVGQLLPSMMAPRAIAQGKAKSAEFETVICRRLQVVDSNGEVRVGMEVDNKGGKIGVADKNGEPRAAILASPDSGKISVWGNNGSAGMDVLASGGAVVVTGKDRNPSAGLSVGYYGGQVSVYSNDGGIRAWMLVLPNDLGGVHIFGRDGKTRAKLEP